jgi:phosphatidylethanolamine/phosphatidyl-N-methylethanolamine N-methyltransferase
MDLPAVEKSYARWAPVYDRTFGAVTSRGRGRAAALVTSFGGQVLEVGVGTGLALPLYGEGVTVTGIDFSPDMLEKARARVAREGLARVARLVRMDARHLDFPDASFDTVSAMHILSVVPEPERVMAEIARVLKPGGRVVIVNHFARERGFLAWLERRTAGLSDLLGWHSDFPRARVLGERTLVLEREAAFPPFRMMTLLVLRKAADGAA